MQDLVISNEIFVLVNHYCLLYLCLYVAVKDIIWAAFETVINL